ncbi:hypothetical protein N5D83_02650 [Pseudomonas chengduensis]|nr:hypothetical protein [Pseudomonas chengduensis]MDH1865717.1 hypothetical protein [Pseudomonas chengduensis]
MTTPLVLMAQIFVCMYEVFGLSHPFKVFSSIVGFDPILVVYNQPICVAIAELHGYKPMNHAHALATE